MEKNLQIKKFYWRIFLITIIPLLIYLWLFSSLNSQNYQFEKRDKAMALDDGCPSLKCSFRQIINIPFKSDYYKFCFVDFGNSQSYPYMAHLTNGDNEQLFNITSKGKYCEIVNLKYGVETLIQEGSNSFDIGEAIKENKTIVVEYGIRDVEPKIKPEFWSGVTKLILTFLAFWAILFLIREVKKYLVECFKKSKQ